MAALLIRRCATDTEALNPHSFNALHTRARIYPHLEKCEGVLGGFKQAERDGSSRRRMLKKVELALKRSKSL